MSKTWTRLIAFLLIAAVVIFLIIRNTGSGKEDKLPQGGGPAQNHGTAIEAMVLQPIDLTETIYSSGSILADEAVDVVSEVPGIIKEIRFQEGHPVQEGAVLIQIDNADLYVQLGKVREQIALARIKEKRQKLLLAKGAISKDSYDQSASELETLKSDSALLSINIKKTTVRAPFTGIIGLREVSRGSYITSNTVIASLVRDNPVKIEFTIPELYVNRVKTGDSIKFKTGASSHQYRGVVYAREPRIDPSTRTLRLRARAANPKHDIAVGAFADITLDLETYKNTLMVPNEAIVPEQGIRKIYRITNGNAEAVQVTTGIRQEKQTQILSGLEAGDTVVTRGVLQVRPGTALDITNLSKSDSL